MDGGKGSVRRLGNNVRVSAQLIDGETGAHLWAERFDHDVPDLAAFQDEVTRRIAQALSLELVDAESAANHVADFVRLYFAPPSSNSPRVVIT